jgi:hypothetical protein
MVHNFGGRGALEANDELGVAENGGGELLEPGIFEFGDEAKKLFEQIIDIVGRVRKIIAEFNFFGFGEPELLENQLESITVEFDAALDLHEIVAMNVLGADFELIPHAGFHGTAAIAKLHTKIGFAGGAAADFLFMHEEKTGDGLIGDKIFDESILH